MHCLRDVTRRAGTGEIQGCEIALCDGIAVLRRRRVPLEGVVGILWHSESILIERSQIVFRARVVLSRGVAVVAEGKRIVLRDTLPMFVEVAENEFGVRIIFGGGRAKPLEGFLEVGSRRMVSQDARCQPILGGGITVFGLRPQVGFG